MNKLKKVIYILWLAFFVILPIILIFFQSFFDIDGSFSFINYQNFFSSNYLKMTFNSFFYAFMISAICLLLSYPIALILTSLKHKKLLLILIIIPSWINLLLKTYAFMGILGSEGPINKVMQILGSNPLSLLFNSSGFLIVSVYIFLPFMIMPIYNSIDAIDSNIKNAANDLGASKFQTLYKVIIPMSKKGIYTAIQLVFIPSLSVFMITRLIAGNRIITLGTAIEQHFLVTGNWGMGSAIGSILIIFMFITMAVVHKSSNKSSVKKKLVNSVDGLSGGTNA